MLPLDLHVLSLPLAFILSQDQTLHCIMFLYFQFDADTYNPSKELTLLDKLYFSVLASCTVDQSFHWTSLTPLGETPFSIGAAKVRVIFEFPNLFSKIFHFLSRNATVLFQNSQPFSSPSLKRECKGTTFFFTSKSFSHTIRHNLRPWTHNSLRFTAVWHCYNFVKIRNCISPSHSHGDFPPNEGL